MVTPSTTYASSAEIIAFEASPSQSLPNGKPTFPQARETWLKAALANPQLTAGEKVLCTALFLHFNSGQYTAHDELIAWPGWAALQAETRLSKTAVYTGLDKLEVLGVLNIEHGGYSRALKRRTRNRYQAVLPRFTTVNLAPGQNIIAKVHQSGPTKVHQGEQDSQRVRLSDLRKESRPPEGASAQEGGPKEDPSRSEQPPSSSLSSLGSFGSLGSRWRKPAGSADLQLNAVSDGNTEDEILSANKYASAYGQELQRRKIYVQKLETKRAFLRSRIAYTSDPWIQKQLDETERLLREGYDRIKSLMSKVH